MWPITHRLSWCSGGDGLTYRGTSTSERDERLTLVVWTGERRGPRVKGVGSKTAAPHHNRDHHMERGDNYDHEARGTEAHQRCDPPPFEEEQ